VRVDLDEAKLDFEIAGMPPGKRAAGPKRRSTEVKPATKRAGKPSRKPRGKRRR
jgi:hypothetical protein